MPTKWKVTWEAIEDGHLEEFEWEGPESEVCGVADQRTQNPYVTNVQVQKLLPPVKPKWEVHKYFHAGRKEWEYVE